jgi:hypothetical protein
MADNSGSSVGHGQEHPDERSGAHEEFAARQHRFLETKAARVLGQLERRDAAMDRDFEKRAVVSLEDLIEQRQKQGGQL